MSQTREERLEALAEWHGLPGDRVARLLMDAQRMHRQIVVLREVDYWRAHEIHFFFEALRSMLEWDTEGLGRMIVEWQEAKGQEGGALGE